MYIFISWIVYAAAIALAAYLLPGVHVADVAAALWAAVALGLINAVLKPILILLTLPINILTLGLFTLVINALLIMLAANLVPGFSVDGFWWAVIYGIILSVLSALLFSAFKK